MLRRRTAILVVTGMFVAALLLSLLTHSTGVVRNDPARNIWIPAELTMPLQLQVAFNDAQIYFHYRWPAKEPHVLTDLLRYSNGKWQRQLRTPIGRCEQTSDGAPWGGRKMRRVGAALAVALLAAGWAGSAWAVPPGLTVEFDGNGEGKVIFAGAKHTGTGMHCSNCHMEVFYVSRSAPITRADHKRKNFCFVCHDGEKAFASKKNCDRCHEEPEEPAEPLEATTAQ